MSEHKPCENNCGRRTFLRESAALLAITSLLGANAYAMPVKLAQALARSGARVSYPVPTVDGVTIDRDQQVMIARAGGMIYAFSLTCPHQNTALRWQASSQEFQCSKHKSRYRTDGAFVSGRATRAMDRFAITREGDTLNVDVDRLFRVDDQPAEWTSAFVRV